MWAALGSMWVLNRKGFHVGAIWTPGPGPGPGSAQRGGAAVRKTFCVWEPVGGMGGRLGKAFVQDERTKTSVTLWK